MASAQAPDLVPALPHADFRPPKEVAPLVEATISGDLHRVREILKSYLTSRSLENYNLNKLWPVLFTALEHDRPVVVSHLLGLGLRLTYSYVDRAIKTKSTAIFDVFLQHGWNINEPLTRMRPPALA